MHHAIGYSFCLRFSKIVWSQCHLISAGMIGNPNTFSVRILNRAGIRNCFPRFLKCDELEEWTHAYVTNLQVLCCCEGSAACWMEWQTLGVVGDVSGVRRKRTLEAEAEVEAQEMQRRRPSKPRR
jgi:hypothetical protein